MWRFIQFCVLLCLALSACSTRHKDLTTAEGTLNEGRALLKDGFYEEARKQFMRIKTEFPQSPLQVQADLAIAQSYFEEESYRAAADAYQDFIKTYPGRPEMADALYELGLSYAKQMPSTPQRDTQPTSRVLDTFTRLVVDYPDYPKTKEAQEWIEKARSQLADKIWEIARFYEKQGRFESAARRYSEYYDQYADTPRAEEALAKQIANLRKAGQKEKADVLANVFEEKFPKSKFISIIHP